MIKKYTFKNTGFSLLELLLVLGILGIISVFAVSLSHSTRNLAKIKDTRTKMREIKSAVLDYYNGHRDLPAPAGSNEVPVAASALNLEQKHRLDSWGRYFHYDFAMDSVYTTRTDITGIEVDGKDVAGVIISGGPDQVLEAGNNSSPYATAGDDIVLPISVNEQAFAIVMDDLEVLQSKMQALDKMFAGIDNNSNNIVDESGCLEAQGCPQTIMGNDPNCSTATLDAITPPASYLFCTKIVYSPAELIVRFYDLNDTILLDPWLNEYDWSASLPTDLRYHKFFSAGPNRISGDSDDILP